MRNKKKKKLYRNIIKTQNEQSDRYRFIQVTFDRMSICGIYKLYRYIAIILY